MKKLIASIVILSAVFSARAELLYFLVDSFDWDGPKYNFAYAMVGVAEKNDDGGWDVVTDTSGNKTYLQVKNSEDGTYGDYVDSVESGYYTKAGPAWADVSDYTSATGDYAFYIETYDANNKQIWGYDPDADGDGSVPMAYATLLKEGHIYTDSTAAQDVSPWVVPEPTSGLLLLFGLAGLALKRKKESRS